MARINDEDTLPSAGVQVPVSRPSGATWEGEEQDDTLRESHPYGASIRSRTSAPPPLGLSAGVRVGAYVLDGLLDRGGFSLIYRARHAERGTPAAVKVLHESLASQPDVVLRFERELEAVQRLRHPGIVQVFDQGRLDDGRPYFVMELLEGMSLEQFLLSRGRLPADEARAILEPLCEALGAAHAQAVVHRDIKPSNIFLCEEEGRRRVVLLDFGVAKLLDAPGPSLTSSRQVVGTLTCIAPEQLLGQPVDARTDVYAVGVLAYRMLVGEPPFADHSGSLLQQMHLYASPPRPSARARVSPAFDEVILRALSKDRALRPASIAAFMDGFRGAVAASRGACAATSGGRARRALAVYTEVQADSGALDEPDDRLLLDIEAILPFVASELTEAGLSLVVETGSSLLFAVDRAEDPEQDKQARRGAVEAARAIYRRLEGRAGRDPRVHVRLCLHVGEVLSSPEGALTGGELLEVAGWVSDRAEDGVFASAEILGGLGAVEGVTSAEH